MEHTTAAAHFKIGMGLLEREKYKLAVSYFDKAIAADPEYSAAYEHRGIAWYHLLHIENAIEDLSRAIALDNDNHNAWFNRAVIFSGQNRHQDALQGFHEAHEACPENTQYLTFLIYTQLKLKDYPAVIRTCNTLLQLAPDDAYALGNRAFAHLMVQDYAQAITYEKKLMRLFPENPAHHNNAGYSFARLGQWHEALEHLDSALFIDPLHAYALNNRGYVKFRLGQHATALRDINASLEVDPSNSYAYKNRALVYLALRERQKALRDLQEARELGFRQDYGPEVDDLLRTEFGE